MSYFHFGEVIVGLFVTALGWRNKRSSDRIELMVNGRMDAALSRIEQLEAKLTEHAVPIPPGAPSIAP